MVTAFILINAEAGKEDKIVEALKGVEGIIEMYVVYGLYDLIVKVEMESLERLRDLVFKRIRSLPYVKATQTSLVAIGGFKYILEEE
jgi:DNA-binding Lrp family transcriptional regulator